MNKRRLAATLVTTLALLAAACGGGGGLDYGQSVDDLVAAGFTEDEATCVVDGLIDEFGEDELVEALDAGGTPETIAANQRYQTQCSGGTVDTGDDGPDEPTPEPEEPTATPEPEEPTATPVPEEPTATPTPDTGSLAYADLPTDPVFCPVVSDLTLELEVLDNIALDQPATLEYSVRGVLQRVNATLLVAPNADYTPPVRQVGGLYDPLAAELSAVGWDLNAADPLVIQELASETNQELLDEAQLDLQGYVENACGVSLDTLFDDAIARAAEVDQAQQVFDDTGTLSMLVPAVWSDVSGAADDGTPQIVASTDIETFEASWAVEGARFLSFGQLPLTADELAELAFEGAPGEADCTRDSVTDYSDGVFTGQRADWSGCPGGAFSIVLAVQDSAGDSYAVEIQVNDPNSLPVDLILGTFNRSR